MKDKIIFVRYDDTSELDRYLNDGWKIMEIDSERSGDHNYILFVWIRKESIQNLLNE